MAIQAGSLWNAVAVTLFFALIAPAGALVAQQVCSRRWIVPLLVGLGLAFDAGLIDTARWGSRLLAAALVGLMLAVVADGASLAYAGAVANHPLAACAGPPLFGVGQLNEVLWGALLGGLAVGHQSLGWGDPGLEVMEKPSLNALEAFLRQRARWQRRHRIRTAGGALFTKGPTAGHLYNQGVLALGDGGRNDWLPSTTTSRFLRFPHSLAGQQRSRGWRSGSVCCVLATRRAPGTCGTSSPARSRSRASRAVWSPPCWGPSTRTRPGSLNAPEPGAVMLDSHLRGEPADRFHPEGRLILIVSGLESTMKTIGPPGEVLLKGPAFVVAHTTPADAHAWMEPGVREPRVWAAHGMATARWTRESDSRTLESRGPVRDSVRMPYVCNRIMALALLSTADGGADPDSHRSSQRARSVCQRRRREGGRVYESSSSASKTAMPHSCRPAGFAWPTLENVLQCRNGEAYYPRESQFGQWHKVSFEVLALKETAAESPRVPWELDLEHPDRLPNHVPVAALALVATFRGGVVATRVTVFPYAWLSDLVTVFVNLTAIGDARGERGQKQGNACLQYSRSTP